MFLRYRAKFYNQVTDKTEFGVFWAADYLLNHCKSRVEERNKLEELIHFFDHNLPIPEYYQVEKNRQKAKSATSWFKDSSEKFISQMNELSNILELNHVEVERINSKRVLGKKIYEDDYQITVLPFRVVAKKVK